MLFILTGVEKNTCEIKGGNKQKQTKKGQHLLGGELCVPWRKEAGGFVVRPRLCCTEFQPV